MQSMDRGSTGQKRVFGFPLKGFSLFQGALLSLSASLMTFCITTTIAIFVLLFMKFHGRPDIDMAISYRDIGFPAGVIVLTIALPTFMILWLRAKFEK
jgi:hypothetical protein